MNHYVYNMKQNIVFILLILLCIFFGGTILYTMMKQMEIIEGVENAVNETTPNVQSETETTPNVQSETETTQLDNVQKITTPQTTSTDINVTESKNPISYNEEDSNVHAEINKLTEINRLTSELLTKSVTKVNDVTKIQSGSKNEPSYTSSISTTSLSGSTI